MTIVWQKQINIYIRGEVMIDMVIPLTIALVGMTVAFVVCLIKNKNMSRGLTDAVQGKNMDGRRISYLENENRQLHNKCKLLKPKTEIDRIYAEYEDVIRDVKREAFKLATLSPYPSSINPWLYERIKDIEKERDEKIKKANNGKQWYRVIIHYKGLGEHNFSFEWDEKTYREILDALDSVMRTKDNSISILDGSGNSLTIDPKEILFIKTGRVNE